MTAGGGGGGVGAAMRPLPHAACHLCFSPDVAPRLRPSLRQTQVDMFDFVCFLISLSLPRLVIV